MASPLGSMHLTSSLRHHKGPSGHWRGLTALSSCAFVAWVGLCYLPLTTSNPHAPLSLAWEVINPKGQVVWSVRGTHTPGTWWPSLHPDVCQLAIGLDTWDLPEVDDPNAIPMGGRWNGRYEGYPSGGHQAGCSDQHRRCLLKNTDFYVCPKDGRSHPQIRKCGGPESLYCAAWGCETTGDAYWRPSSSWDWITVRRNSTSQRCDQYSSDTIPALYNSLNISFTRKGKQAENLPSWYKGRTWGLRFYAPGYDYGLWFTLKLRQESSPSTHRPQPGYSPSIAPATSGHAFPTYN